MKAHGSILLVDDEAKIRTLLTKALIEDGNEVVATESDMRRALIGGMDPIEAYNKYGKF